MSISCSFCGSGIWAQLSWVLSLGSDTAMIRVLAGLRSHLEAQLGESWPKLIQVAGTLIFFATVRQMPLLPCWLESGG